MEEYLDKLTVLGKSYGPQLALALIVLIIGLPLIRLTTYLVEKGLKKRGFEATVRPFLVGAINVFLKVALLLVVLQTIGIKTTSFIAILGAAGLAIALAFKDSIGNFAAAVMILYFRPYRVGDYIEITGVNGTVKEVQIFSTVLLTPDNKRISVPNGTILNGVIVNYTAEDIRRVDLVFGIAYEDDFQKAKEIILEVIQKNPDTLKTPAPFLGVVELADSSVNIVTRVWGTKDNYWPIYFYLQEKVKLALDENGISIPYPQRMVWNGKEASAN